MVSTEASKLVNIGGGLVMNIVYAILGIGLIVLLYYTTRFIQKNSRKQKAFTIQADIIDRTGEISFDKLAFVKSEDTGLLEMIFRKRKTDSIPPIPKHYIRNGRAMLLNYAPGHYAIVDVVKLIRNVEQGINSIPLVDMGMKKYLVQKQKEILYNQENKKRKWEMKAPWIILGISLVAALLVTALLFVLGGHMDSSNVAARTAECITMGAGG